MVGEGGGRVPAPLAVSGVALCPGELQDPVRGFSLPRYHLLWPERPARAAAPVSGATGRGSAGAPGWALSVAAGPGGEAGVGGSGGAQQPCGEAGAGGQGLVCGCLCSRVCAGVGGRGCARMLRRSCQPEPNSWVPKALVSLSPTPSPGGE